MGRKLGRNTNQRAALFRSLVRSLLLHEHIQTTEAKAKAIKGLVDRIISKGKQDKALSSKNHSFLVQKDIIRKLTDDIVPRYEDRVSGFTTTARLGPRKGDGAMMVQMSLIEGQRKETKVPTETRPSSRVKKEKK